MFFYLLTFFLLKPEYERFLNYEAYYLILKEEKEVFLKLEEDYQRDLFIEEFWKRRDNFPETYENEFKDGFLQRLEEGTQEFGFYDPRTRFYAIFGPPKEIISIKCESFVPSYVWKYSRIEAISSSAIILFYQPLGIGNFKLFEGFDEEEIFSQDQRKEICFEKIYISQAIQWTKNALLEGKLQKLLSPPPVDLEDVKDILKRSIIIPKGLENLKTTFSLNFKEGYGGKTTVLGTLLFMEESLEGVEIKGEILKDKKLYDSFKINYYFSNQLPPFPATFQINLFPGNYEIKIFSQTLDGKRGFSVFQKLEVPSIKPLISEKILEKKFKLRIPFLQEPQVGLTQFQVDAPENIKKVQFFLNEKLVAQKNSPPFFIELDLGKTPLPQIVEAVGFDEENKEIDRDLLFLNQGIDVFKVKIINPRGNILIYKEVPFKLEILKPKTKNIKKVELYEGNDLIAEFFSPPFEGKVSIPYKPQPIIRALAYLEDERKAEDIVILNSSGFEEVLKINNVILNISVFNEFNKPVLNLKKDSFEIFEDNIKQDIEEFKEARDLPIKFCLLIDTSASMEKYLVSVKKALSTFVENFMKEKDEGFAISFSSVPNYLSYPTNDKELLKKSFENLKSEGNTNLYDALIFALYQFHSFQGRKAIILLTDGKDTGSSNSFEDLLNYIKIAQIPIYPIALNIKFSDLKVRNDLSKIAENSGGSFYFINEEELNFTYERIAEELRSQYIISYVSKQTGSEFRKIKVKVKGGFEAKTISGYYP